MTKLPIRPLIVLAVAATTAAFLTMVDHSASIASGFGSGKGDRLVPTGEAGPVVERTVARAEIPTSEIGHPAAVILIDGRGRVVYHNDPSRGVTAVTRDVVIGLDQPRSVPDRDRSGSSTVSMLRQSN